MDGRSTGVGVSNGVGVDVRSEGCTNGFSDAPEPDAASKLVWRSKREGLGEGEWTATSPDDDRVWSMSSRGTAYPSRATLTASCDLKVRVAPGPTEVPVEVRPERTRLAVRVTLERREGAVVYRTDSRADFRRCRSASSQRLRVCSNHRNKKKKDRQRAGGA